MGDFPDPAAMERITPPPITNIENGIKRYLYIHLAYPYFFFKQNFSFEVAV